MTKPILYVVTALWRLNKLEKIAESLQLAHDYFWVRWLPVQHCPEGDDDGCGKRNVAMDMIDKLEPGWIYNLDDDNLIHPCLASSLSAGIVANPNTHVFFVRTVRGDGTPFMHEPVLVPTRIDTACFVVSTTAAMGIRWDGLDKTIPDYNWIRQVCERGHKPVLLDGPAYYNATADASQKVYKWDRFSGPIS